MRGARGKFILVILAALVVCGAFYFTFIRGRQGELADVRTQVDAEEAKTVELQTTVQRLQALEENAAQLEARLANIRELIPAKDQVPDFIFQVQDEADRAGVGFVQITPELPKPPAEGAQVAQVRVTIGAEGGYFALQDFLRRLYEFDRALRIDNLSISANESEDDVGKPLGLLATARIFFELPAGSATAPAAPAGGTTAPTTPAPVPSAPPAT
jgi:Tfp pilus assembly protein PilO